MPEANGNNEDGRLTIHDKNLENVRAFFNNYKEKHASKLFQGVHLRYLTKVELIKILDIAWVTLIERKKDGR